MRRRVQGDEGASLVIALAFVTIVSIGTTALITLADTGLRTAQAVRQQGYELYSASGAVDRAITAVRQDLTAGRHLGSCPTTTTTLNEVTTEVVCVGAVGSGSPSGGSSNTDNTPRNAVLTLADNGVEDGLVQESNNELRISGPVVSNSTVKVNVASAALNVAGPVTARGACSPNVTSDPPPPDCDRGAAAIENSSDPGYAMHPEAPLPVPPALAPAPVGCPPAGGPRLVRFSPGKYDSAAALNDVFTRCSGGVFHFEPGFYYFDFPSADPTWKIHDSGTRVVGGVPARWSPSDPAPGALGVTVPFPDDTAATPTGGCVRSDESATTPGVQFAFGGSSRVRIQDAKVELCARGSNTEQQIAVYGVPPARDTTVAPPPPPTSQTVVRLSAGPATAGGTPLYTVPEAALVQDGLTSVVTGSEDGSGSTATLTVGSLTGSAIPTDATIDQVRLRIVHRPENNNVTRLQAVLSSQGSTLATAGDATGTCTGATSSAICRNPSATLYDQTVGLAGTFTPAVLNQPLDVRLETTVKAPRNQSPGVHHVDLLALEVVYTPAPTVPPDGYKKLSGCLVVALASGGCALLETVGGPTALAVHGTVYAPTAALQLELTNVSNQVLRRGVVARTARVKVTGSSSFLGSPISLPPATGSPANRKVVFTARQGGVDVLRTVVQFDDTGTVSPDRRADITSWSVLR
jgi:hypothetical protein